ncbi:hypothetical protein B0H12DRAFT_1225123 [Mycena haematopus]|nr:hypothetical protein B0H12DRAFT_1225123 [Mycena haematopus]
MLLAPSQRYKALGGFVSRAVNLRHAAMPSLQPSSSSVLSLSTSSTIAVVAFLVVVLGGLAGCFFVVPYVVKVMKSRARTKDVESSAESVATLYSVEKAKKVAAAAVLARARVRLPSLQDLKRAAPPVPKSIKIVGPCRRLTYLADSVDVSARFSASRTRIQPGLSPLRTIAFLAPESSVVAFNHKQVNGASHLVAARIRLAVTAKKNGAVIGKSPFSALRKTVTMRHHLQSLKLGEVPAAFVTRTRARPGPSPLRAVFPEPEPVVATSASNVEAPSIAHTIVDLLATAYNDDHDADFGFLHDSDNYDEDPFIYDLGRAIPAAPVCVDVPTIIVESPSLVFNKDQRDTNAKPSSRKRSNSFIGWKQGLAPSKDMGHGSSSKGSRGKDKENEGFLRVPSASPRRTRRRA